MPRKRKGNSQLWKKELSCVEKLKLCCDDKGKEIQEKLEDSANCLHELGLIYKERSPDKFSLIRSAGLLNAAIVRKPSNIVKVKKDLSMLHSHILKLAKAENKTFDICRFVESVARKFKTMRGETKMEFKKVPVVPDDFSADTTKIEKQIIERMERLQTKISDQYMEIMRYVSDKCIEVMGKPPCQYSVAAMGSLVRKEITPYSDFEHLILLDDEIKDSDNKEEVIEYFRWFSLLFHVVIIGLGETIIPCLAIPSLNDNNDKKNNWFFDRITPRGISFDGMVPYACKFPLGRQQGTKNKPWATELIRPVSEMLDYLDINEDQKNGYHIGDMVSTTCFVSGEKDLHNDFIKNVSRNLQENASFHSRENILRLVKEDLEKFDLVQTFHEKKLSLSFNIKQIVYRTTTLFVSALGKLHSVFDACSNFEVIKILKERKVFDQSFAHNLAYAIALACQVRLHVYISKRSQDDYLIAPSVFYGLPESGYSSVQSIIGKKSLFEYFNIASQLHKHLRRNIGQINAPGVFEMDSCARLQNFYNLGMMQKVIDAWNCMSEENRSTIFLFATEAVLMIAESYSSIGNFKSALDVLLKMRKTFFISPEQRLYYSSIALSKLTTLERENEEVFLFVKKNISNISPTMDRNVVLETCDSYGQYLFKIKKDHKEALKLFMYVQVLLKCKIEKEIRFIDEEEYNLRSLLFIAECLCQIGNYDLSIIIVEGIFDMYDRAESKDVGFIVWGHTIMGKCYWIKEDFVKAKERYVKELELRSNLPDQDEDLKQIRRDLDLIQRGIPFRNL